MCVEERSMLDKRIHRSRFFLSVMFVLIMAAGIQAQSQANTGNIEGRVTDPNGAAVPTVTVTATNEATSLSKSANADSEGNYRVLFLPPGKYKVTATGAQGFAAP